MLYSKISLILLVVVGSALGNVVLANTTTTLRPVADGGNDSAGWFNTFSESQTTCSAADCYVEVDESSGSVCTNSSDGDDSYVVSGTNGASQTFDIDESVIPDGSTIDEIAITVCYKRYGTSNGKIQTRYCYNGSCADYGENLSSGEEYTEGIQSHAVSFTKTSDSDIEIGVTNKAVKNTRVSQISAVVTYTPISTAGSSPGRKIRVILSGRAYPGSKIEVLRRGSADEDAPYLTVPLETHKVSDDGTFDLSLGALVLDEYFFALRVEDKDGRKTGIIAFDVNLKTTDILEAKDIFIPPTIELEKTVVARDKTINIFGYAGSNNLIEVEIDGLILQTVKAGEDGYWTAVITTSALTFGEHAIKVRQADSSGQQSRFSLTKTLKISLLKFPEADFNGDDVINITDWSVFLFRWGQGDENVRLAIDLNKDGKINISDFSMFLDMMKI